MPSQRQPFRAKSLQPWLEECGYTEDKILTELAVAGGRHAAIAGFSQRPFDSRSACVMAMDVTTSPAEDAAACRVTGAPIALLCQGDELLWWKQGPTEQHEYLRVPVANLEGFFASTERISHLAPSTERKRSVGSKPTINSILSTSGLCQW